MAASLLVLMSILVLAMASVKTFIKGFRMYEKEKDTRQTSVSFTEPAGSRFTAELLINTDDGQSRLVNPTDASGSPMGERDSHELDVFKESVSRSYLLSRLQLCADLWSLLDFPPLPHHIPAP